MNDFTIGEKEFFVTIDSKSSWYSYNVDLYLDGTYILSSSGLKNGSNIIPLSIDDEDKLATKMNANLSLLGSITVKTYDQSGNFIGETSSQATVYCQTIGALNDPNFTIGDDLELHVNNKTTVQRFRVVLDFNGISNFWSAGFFVGTDITLNLHDPNLVIKMLENAQNVLEGPVTLWIETLSPIDTPIVQISKTGWAGIFKVPTVPFPIGLGRRIKMQMTLWLI